MSTAQAIREASTRPTTESVAKAFGSGVRVAVAVALFVPLALLAAVVALTDPDPRRAQASSPATTRPTPATTAPTVTASLVSVTHTEEGQTVTVDLDPMPSGWVPCQPWTLCAVALDAWTVNGDRRARFANGFEGGVLASCEAGALCPLTPRTNARWCIGPDGNPYSDPGRGACP
jgi:hypothetical protein